MSQAQRAPALTIAVCTWNRAALLRRTLASFAALRVPAGVDFEVLVVDNGCTDRTPAVLAEFARVLPLRAVREPAQGIAHARNRAAREARGAYVLCTDDDVEVEPDWLAAYWAAIQAHPHADVFGGVILPRFEGTPPAWLLAAWEVVKACYAVRDLGPQGFDLAPNPSSLPYGGNYAVRTAALRCHTFDPRLGHRRGARGVGEETKLMLDILAAGGRGRWVPEARVWHWIPRARQSLRHVRRYAEAYGRMRAWYEPVAPPTPAELRHELRRHTRKYWRKRLRREPPASWVAHYQSAAVARGMLRALSAAAGTLR